MAEDLDDGEFWLPSHFLTDDDILMDFDFDVNSTAVAAAAATAAVMTTATVGGGGGGGSSSSVVSDFEFGSAESDEEISLHLSSCPLHFKGCGGVLSSSPQSTLCRCVCNQSSSRESASPPPPQVEETLSTAVATTVADNNTTLNLLNKAADEVARLKLRSENKKIGTGFFDCSQNRVSYPPIKNPPPHFQPQFLHYPPMVWTPSNVVQYKYNQPNPQQQQNRATKNENKSSNINKNNNRPLGLPLSAWPPLQAQTQPKSQAQQQAQPQPQPQPQLGPLFVGPPKGTGVFLPRRVATTPANENRKKSDGNCTKTKNGKGSQSNNRRNSGKITTTTTITTTNHNDIQLPQEWIY